MKIIKSIDKNFYNPSKACIDWCTSLGHGAFGTLFLMKIKQSNCFFAVKTFRKDILLKEPEKNIIENCVLELTIMKTLRH